MSPVTVPVVCDDCRREIERTKARLKGWLIFEDERRKLIWLCPKCQHKYTDRSERRVDGCS